MQFRLDGWEGKVFLDDDEVQNWKWVTLKDLYSDIEKQPDKYTSWIKAELSILKDSLLSEANVCQQTGTFA